MFLPPLIYPYIRSWSFFSRSAFHLVPQCVHFRERRKYSAAQKYFHDQPDKRVQGEALGLPLCQIDCLVSIAKEVPSFSPKLSISGEQIYVKAAKGPIEKLQEKQKQKSKKRTQKCEQTRETKQKRHRTEEEKNVLLHWGKKKTERSRIDENERIVGSSCGHGRREGGFRVKRFYEDNGKEKVQVFSSPRSLGRDSTNNSREMATRFCSHEKKCTVRKLVFMLEEIYAI